MNTARQIFMNQGPTAGASSGCVPGINQHDTAAGPLCLVRSELHQLKPGSISDGFSQAVVPQHSLAVQLLKNDNVKGINQAMTKFMGEILAPVNDALVNMRNSLASVLAFRRPLLLLGQFALCPSQLPLIISKKARIINLLPIGQSSKALQPDINANCFLRFGQWLRLYLTGETGIPLACAVPSQGECLNFTPKRAVDNGFDKPYLAYPDQRPIKGEAKLGVGEAIISSLALKSRIARLLPSLYPSKESFESKVNSLLNILKHLRIDYCQRGTLSLPLRQKFISLIQADGLLLLLPSIRTKGKCLVEDPAAFLKYLIEKAFLFTSGQQTIFKGLTHIVSITYNCLNSKDEARGNSPPR